MRRDGTGQARDETFSSAAQISAQRHSPPPSPAISYTIQVSQPFAHLRRTPEATPIPGPSNSLTSVAYLQQPLIQPTQPLTISVTRLSFTCPSSSPRLNPTSTSNTPHLSLIQPQAKLTHPQQSVTTPGSRTAPPSSCLQLIKSCQLHTPTHHLYQLQIQLCLQLIKPQRSSHRSRLVRTTHSQQPRYPALAAWVTSHLQLMQAQPIDWTRFRHGSNTPKSSCQKILTASRVWTGQ